MLTVIPTSPPGTTRGVAAIVKLMENNPDNLLEIIRITKTEENGGYSFTYIAIFREKNSLGDFVAFINEEGTNWGAGSGGQGRRGRALIESYIDDKEISVTDIDWEEMDGDIRDQLEFPYESDYDRCKVWERFIFDEYLSKGQFWDSTPYELNARWKQMLDGWMD